MLITTLPDGVGLTKSGNNDFPRATGIDDGDYYKGPTKQAPDARRWPEGTFVICGSKSPFGPSAYLFASVTGMPARISSAFSLRYPAWHPDT